MNRLGEYINYLITARGRHGIHSPFVYDFVDKCLTTKLDKNFHMQRTIQVAKWKKDLRVIHKKDFGAGSRRMQTERTIRDLYRMSSSKGRYLELLYQLAAFYRPSAILELGTNIGVGAFAFRHGNPAAAVDTMEGCLATQAVAMELFPDDPKVRFLSGLFQTVIPTLDRTYDLIYIDGHHDGPALLRYLSMLEPFSHDETIFVLDDIRWSSDMLAAWKKIVASEQFHVTLDLYKVGIVVPRKHQQKEHFTIRLPRSWKGLI